MDDGVEGEVRAANITDMQLYPVMARSADFRSVYRIDDVFWSGRMQLDKPLVGQHVTLDLPASVEGRNILINRTSWTNGALSEFRKLLVQLDRLTRLIRN